MDVGNKKLAVLIDADNSSATLIEPLLEEIAKYGIAIVKRIYGDWSSEYLKKWRDVLLPHAIIPIQQFAYTSGKNSTDMTLVIDAMDLLYSGTFDGFCIVSSDSDFTRLASRIRESGLSVYGFGRKHTPEAFRKACDTFIFTENLDVDYKNNKDEDNKSSEHNYINNDFKEPNLKLEPALMNLIYKAVKDQSDEHGWASLSMVRKYISNVKPEFDPRTYGKSKISELFKDLGVFEIKILRSQLFVRKRSFSLFVKLVQNLINQISNNEGWAKTEEVLKSLESSEIDFNPLNYGFVTTFDAFSSIHGGWLEFKKIKNSDYVKVNKIMP